MTSNDFDIQIAATEIQIAEAIRVSDPETAATIRRLAFERDGLRSELQSAICRLQFPDGTVPGNAREAAEGWKRWADEFQRRAKAVEAIHAVVVLDAPRPPA